VLQPDVEARGMAGKLIDGVTRWTTPVSSTSWPNTPTTRPGCKAAHRTTSPRRRQDMGIEVNGTTYETDEEGYLVNLSDWTEDIGKVLAKGENVEMTPSHWEVVNFLRDYYNEYQIAPAVRVLTKAIGKQLGPEKGNSKYLYELFPYGPAKQACKIAGLPKPTGCV
jgi:TusE/DsrC/DsvC family sulfur relay protein